MSGFAGKQFAAAFVMASTIAFAGQALAGQAQGADLSLPVSGNLFGSVVDNSGNPQMGATVQLFNRFERIVGRAITAPDGRFAFTGLALESYSIRVSLPSFLPAFRDRIAIKAGLDSVLQIHLATLFSNVQLSYTLPTGAMTNDWKWALRSAPVTRPITRFLPDATSSSATLHPSVFSGTHAMVSLSGGDGGWGDGGLIDSGIAASDLGTGFALSTNLLGKNQLQVAGSYGQGGNYSPADIALCAIYSRNANGGFGDPPEVTLTVSQLGRFGTALPGAAEENGQMPVLRTMSLSFYEVTDPFDNLHIEYGMTGESVDYVQHTSRVSPFARATLDLGAVGDLVAAYSNGGRPDELSAHQKFQTNDDNAPASDDLLSAVNALARLPEISNRDGRLELEKTQNYELGYDKKAGSRTFAASAFYEQVANGRMNLAGDLSPLDSSDLLFDGVSKTATYNIGRYDRKGFITSIDQRLSDFLDFAASYGRMGGFSVLNSTLGSMSGVQQNFLQLSDRDVASVNFKARVPASGTRLIASYGWIDGDSVVPVHVFTTQNAYLAPGLNFAVKQPLPSFFGMPGHLELTADLRNLLAQGYIPLSGSGTQPLLIVQSPRAIRGGLSFTF